MPPAQRYNPTAMAHAMAVSHSRGAVRKFRFIKQFTIGSVGALIERPRAIGDRPYKLICSINRNLKFFFLRGFVLVWDMIE